MRAILSFFLVLFAFSACGTPSRDITAGGGPEESLLGVFLAKARVLREYEEKGDYSDYFARENESYPSEQEAVNRLVTEINARFNALPAGEREGYQRRWRERYQPVIDDIYARTQALVARETAALTPERMAGITELSVKRRAMEKDHPQAELAPVFFVPPEAP